MRQTLGALVGQAQRIIDQVVEEMCETRCKYPDIWDEEKEGMPVEESEHCETCPLNRL